MLTNKDLTKLGKEAIRLAREENKIFNLPNVVSIDGKIVYELPSGEVVEDYDFQERNNQC